MLFVQEDAFKRQYTIPDGWLLMTNMGSIHVVYTVVQLALLSLSWEAVQWPLALVVYKTSLDMFCDVKPNFSQLLKAHVYDGRPFWFSFF